MPTTRSYLSLSVAAFAVLVVMAWLGLVPRVMTSSTFAWVAAVALGLYSVTLMSLKSGQSTESVAQILHDAETKGVTRNRQ